MKVAGFILARWLLSFSIMTMSLLMSSALLFSWYQQINRLHTCCDQKVPVYIALDLLAADVHQADQTPKQNGDKLVLHYEKQYVSWTYTKQRLLRRSHAYDASEKRWRGSSSLMAEALASCQFQLIALKKQHKDPPRGITISMLHEGTQERVMYTAYMRKGMRL